MLAIGGNALTSPRNNGGNNAGNNLVINTMKDHEFPSAPHTPTRNVGVVGGGALGSPVPGGGVVNAGAMLGGGNNNNSNSGPPSPSAGGRLGLSGGPAGVGGPGSGGGGTSSSLLGPADEYVLCSIVLPFFRCL